jgi:hypothetical protein
MGPRHLGSNTDRAHFPQRHQATSTTTSTNSGTQETTPPRRPRRQGAAVARPSTEFSPWEPYVTKAWCLSMMPPAGWSTPKGAAIMPTVTGEGFRPIALRPSPAHSSSHLPPPQHHRHRRKHQPSLQPHHHGNSTPALEATTKRGEGPCSPSPPRPTEVAPQTARPCVDLHRRRRSRHTRHRTRPIRRPPPPHASCGCRRHKQAMPDGGLRPRQPSPPTRVANAAVRP